MAKSVTMREIGLSGCDDTIAQKAARILEDTAASGTLAIESDISAAIRERRLDDALNLQRAAFRARMLGGLNRARSGFERDQLTLRDMPAERRGHRRSVTLLTIGKIAARGVDHPCVVRDLSEGGAGFACDTRFAVDQPVTLAMRGLTPTPAKVRWCDGKFGGLQFDTLQDAQVILSVALRRDTDTPRAPRFVLEVPVDLAVRGRHYAMISIDVSGGGMKLRGACPAPVGTAVEALLGGCREVLNGTVCWARAGLVGIGFAQPMTPAELDVLLARAAS